MAYELPDSTQNNEGSIDTAAPAAVPMPQPFVPATRPEGFAPNFMELTDEQKRSLPVAPPEFQPGLTSVGKAQDERGLGQRIADAFSSVHGDIPLSMKIKLAKQDADIHLSTNKLAWATYYQHNVNYRKDLEAHNAHMAVQGLQLRPMMMDEIFMAKPENKQKVTDRWVKTLNGFGPGLGDMALMAYQSPGVSQVQNLMLKEPGAIGEAHRALATQQGLEKWITTPQTKDAATTKAKDLLWLAQANLPRPMKDKLDAGTLTEEEFSKAMPEVAFNLQGQGWTQEYARAAQAFMTEEEGQKTLAGLGIKTNSALLKQQGASHGKDDTAIQKMQNRDAMEADAVLQDAKKNPDKYSKSYLAQVKDTYDKLIHVKAPETNPGTNENNAFNQQFAIDTANKFGPDGKVGSVEEIANLPKKDQDKYYALADQTKQKIAERGPLAGNTAKLSMPHDSNEKPVYVVKDSRIARVSKPMTQAEYLNYPGGFTMTPAQKEHNSKIDAAEIGGKELLTQAEGAYTGKTWLEKKQEVLAENMLTSAPGFFSDQVREEAAARYPKLAAYVAARDAVLGTYAKGLGGETGVLTDQDIARVRKLFSGAYDNKETRAAKMKTFQRIIDLNRKALANILTSNQGTDNEGQVSPAQWMEAKKTYRDQVQGMLGDVEAKAKAAQAQGQPKEAKSLAEDAPTQANPGSIDSLKERMRKGLP